MDKSANPGEKLIGYIFLIASIIVLTIFGYAAILANTDLADGRFVLFMDERITFDGVKKILHPGDALHFLHSVLNGGDHRYGRSLWNSIAIFSTIPEILFGDTGQIIATRMLQVILIVASYSVFAFGLLRSWFLRFVLLITFLAIPFSGYYMTMPKPEPLQLFFLSLFSYFFVKRNAEFSWYWIFAGLAFGTKISALPALLIFILISVASKIRAGQITSSKESICNAATAFFVGLAIAVPILFIPLLLIAGGYLTFNWISRRFHLATTSRYVIFLIEAIVIILASSKSFKTWFTSTFSNTTHGADQASTNALSWLDYFFNKWLIAPSIIGLIFLIFILIYIMVQFIQILNSRAANFGTKTMALTIAMAGLALNIAIMIGTKRLWGFYLYPGMILMITGTILLIDLNLSNPKSDNNQVTLNKLFGYFISLYLLLIATLYWAPKTINELRELSLRTKTSEYAIQYSSYQLFTNFLDHFQVTEGRKLRVAFTPSLFPPARNDKYEIIEFWGPYTSWTDKPDIIIFGVENTPRSKPIPKDSPSYNNFLKEREGYSNHVTTKDLNCKNSPCYIRVMELPNGGEILVLNKID